ncbi:hypothetical protein PybrP1_007259 [[Pythium] brassicae (nom. inval.)]|nr:hypothetical protein PybrP1_007259 [[Pythium] brassicae (nom. inval.)]
MRLLQVRVADDPREGSCAWSRKLSEETSGRYEQILRQHDGTASAVDGEDSASWQRTLDGCGSSAADIGVERYYEARCFNNVKEVAMEQVPLQHAPQLKRLPLDEAVLLVPAPLLRDQSARILAKIYRKNAACILTLSLELLESIIHQQQVNVKRISENPSAFSHDAIFDACSSFRQDGILDELATEFGVSVIERELQSPVDIVVDERNGIVILATSFFSESMKSLTYKLATSQIQFQQLWIIIEDTSRFIRSIIDQCAQTALEKYRTLPRMWFERPFLLEEESQLERFLASTQVITPYAAQSLLHKISIDDLFSNSFEHLERLVQDSVSRSQLQLLWSMMHQNHGIQQQGLDELAMHHR